MMMRVLDPGHRYALRHLDGDGETVLQFVNREGEKYPGNAGACEGTTMQEILRALIDRAAYVNGQASCEEAVSGTCCGSCGHVGCHGSCRGVS